MTDLSHFKIAMEMWSISDPNADEYFRKANGLLINYPDNWEYVFPVLDNPLLFKQLVDGGFQNMIVVCEKTEIWTKHIDIMRWVADHDIDIVEDIALHGLLGTDEDNYTSQCIMFVPENIRAEIDKSLDEFMCDSDKYNDLAMANAQKVLEERMET